MRRIITAREQVQLLAAWRKTAFDWQQRQYDPGKHTSYEQKLFDDVELHKASLENGHELHAWRYTQHPDDKEGWQWAISDPSRSSEYGSYPDDGDAGDWSNYDGSPPQISTWLACGGVGAASDADLSRKHRKLDLEVAHADHIPTLEHAKAQAQNHYQNMFPIGTDTGSHDSGVDYSDLSKFMEGM
jgi:hypothetical protein